MFIAFEIILVTKSSLFLPYLKDFLILQTYKSYIIEKFLKISLTSHIMGIHIYIKKQNNEMCTH